MRPILSIGEPFGIQNAIGMNFLAKISRESSGKSHLKNPRKPQKSINSDGKGLIFMRPISQEKTRLGWNTFALFGELSRKI